MTNGSRNVHMFNHGPDAWCFMCGDAADAGIQYKGTDLCMDIRCECGETSHFDGEFAYAIECVNCGRKYDMPSRVALQPFSGEHEPKKSKKGTE